MNDESVRIRIRIGHKKTASRGWEHETTVEIEGDATAVADFDMRWWLAHVDQLGRTEAITRNQSDQMEGRT